MEPRAILRQLFDAAVEAALPKPEWFTGLPKTKGRTIVIGAGKAAASMAQAFETYWPHPLEGLVVTRYGHALPTRRIEVVEAAHPVPDEAGLAAARRILAMVQGLTEDDLVVAFISGGGSSLLTLPAEGVTLEQKRSINRALLRSGATIAEINAVRKSLSAIKGGRLLAAAQPARVVTYVLSDVPGDDPSIVASGPTVPDQTPEGEAQRILERYGIEVPEDGAPWREVRPEGGTVGEGVPGAPQTSPISEIHLVASSQISLTAAAQRAQQLGLNPIILGDAIEGESREVAQTQAALALDTPKNSVLLSGGETTVTVRGQGRGGRNVEFLAALAQALDGAPNIYALAADTDGIDGIEPVAGAFIDPITASRAGQQLAEALAHNDAHTLFESLGDQLITGPTHTNVNDFRAILIT
jgi:glycerate 2-kinase